MHRYNMAHRKAAREVFPSAIEARTPVVAFTATRWASLMKPYPKWPAAPPTAADCYRFCLAQSAVHIVLTGPKSIDELEQNLAVLTSAPMDDERCNYWARFGDIVYNHGRGDADKFESLWP
jgi:aryl-alcohol dehydrogenase-like predicted oxidoreductase